MFKIKQINLKHGTLFKFPDRWWFVKKGAVTGRTARWWEIPFILIGIIKG